MIMPRMTWQQLADFINNEMPECNRNGMAAVWDDEIGRFYPIKDIDQLDYDEEPNPDNFYTVNINTATDWWE